jgi:hypothetical protein
MGRLLLVFGLLFSAAIAIRTKPPQLHVTPAINIKPVVLTPATPIPVAPKPVPQVTPAPQPKPAPVVQPVQPVQPAQPVQPVRPAQPVQPVNPLPPPSPPAPKLAELLFFTQPGCRPCAEMEGDVNQLERMGTVVHRYDAQSDTAAAEKWRVTGTPTSIAVVDGRETGRFTEKVGLVDLEKLVGRIKNGVIANRGKNGWRLRVLYPPDSEIARDLMKQFDEDQGLCDFADKFGYQAIATDDPYFAYWYKMGYPTDQTSVVLVDDNNAIVYRCTGKKIPKSSRDVLADLNDSVNGRRFNRNIARFSRRIPTGSGW